MESLFEFNQQYSQMAEDYANKIVIYQDGSLELYQMETSNFEPELKSIAKSPDSRFAEKITSLLNKHNKKINKIPFNVVNENAQYDIKLADKEFSLEFLDRFSRIDENGKIRFKNRETNSKDFIIDFMCSIKNIFEEFYPGVVNWNRIDNNYWFA